MNTKTILQTLVFFAVFLTLQGCYTQLATHNVVQVQNRPDPRPVKPIGDLTDTVAVDYANAEINEYHYHFYDRDNSCFGGCPDYYEADYYVNINLGYDYYRYRPYPRQPWRWSYSRYYWDYPYYYAHYYDPHYYDYGWGYNGYWSYHPYNSWHYGGYYYGDSPDNEKRDWNRRGDNLTDRTIQRPTQTNSPSGSSLNNIMAPVSSTPATPGNSRTVIRSKDKDDSKSDTGKKKRHSVRRSKSTKRGSSHDSTKPKEVKKTRSSSRDEPKPSNNSRTRNKASHKRHSSSAYSNFEKAVSFAATVSKSVKNSSHTSKITKTKKRSSSGSSKKSSRNRSESKRSVRR